MQLCFRMTPCLGVRYEMMTTTEHFVLKSERDPGNRGTAKKKGEKTPVTWALNDLEPILSVQTVS